MKTLSLSRFKKHKIGIAYRPDTAKAFKLAKDVSQWLKEQKLEVYTVGKAKCVPGTKNWDPAKSKIDLNLVLVLGGDGTYLAAVHALEGRDIPIIGVNQGSLGFLTETRVADLYSTLTLALQNKLELRPRSVLKIQIRRKSKVRAEYHALNEMVMERGESSFLIHVNILVDKSKVTDLKADGLIVSTPTGSTAYNLAAGGPILHPDVHAFVMTAISPHSLTSRPIIFPDSKKLSLQIIGKTKKACLTVDGQRCTTLDANDEIICSRARRDHFVVRRPSHNYFNLLKEKLKFGERE